VAVRAGLPGLFAGNETNELGEELVGSYLHQVHLYHELESNTYDRSCQPTMHTKRSSGWFIALIGQTSNPYGIFAQHNCVTGHVKLSLAVWLPKNVRVYCTLTVTDSDGMPFATTTRSLMPNSWLSGTSKWVDTMPPNATAMLL
jgi:hypothetical protein